VDTFVHEHALGRATHLTGAVEAAEDGALRGAREIRVLADDDGTVAARLDQRALEAGRAHDLLCRAVRTDEPDSVDVRMRDEPFADVAAAVDDVDDTVGKSRVGHDLHEVRHRDRRPLRRLDHDRVADRDPGSDQLHRDQRRKVPRRDRAVDAVRLPEREQPFADVLRRDDRRLHPLDVLGGDAEVLGRLFDVGQGFGRVRLPLLERQLAREVLAALVDQIGDCVADLRAVPCRQRGPRRLRLARRRDGAVDVRCGGVRRLGKRFTRYGRDDRPRAVARCFDPVAADEVLECPDGDCHGAPFPGPAKPTSLPSTAERPGPVPQLVFKTSTAW
jgi:hypothetical protein